MEKSCCTQNEMLGVFQNLGCDSAPVCSVGSIVYAFLSRDKNKEIVPQYDARTKRIYFRAKIDDKLILFVPVSLAEQLTCQDLKDMTLISADPDEETIFVFVDCDSTCVCIKAQLTDLKQLEGGENAPS